MNPNFEHILNSAGSRIENLIEEVDVTLLKLFSSSDIFDYSCDILCNLFLDRVRAEWKVSLEELKSVQEEQENEHEVEVEDSLNTLRAIECCVSLCLGESGFKSIREISEKEVFDQIEKDTSMRALKIFELSSKEQVPRTRQKLKIKNIYQDRDFLPKTLYEYLSDEKGFRQVYDCKTQTFTKLLLNEREKLPQICPTAKVFPMEKYPVHSELTLLPCSFIPNLNSSLCSSFDIDFEHSGPIYFCLEECHEIDAKVRMLSNAGAALDESVLFEQDLRSLIAKQEQKLTWLPKPLKHKSRTYSVGSMYHLYCWGCHFMKNESGLLSSLNKSFASTFPIQIVNFYAIKKQCGSVVRIEKLEKRCLKRLLGFLVKQENISAAPRKCSYSSAFIQCYDDRNLIVSLGKHIPAKKKMNLKSEISGALLENLQISINFTKLQFSPVNDEDIKKLFCEYVVSCLVLKAESRVTSLVRKLAKPALQKKTYKMKHAHNQLEIALKHLKHSNPEQIFSHVFQVPCLLGLKGGFVFLTSLKNFISEFLFKFSLQGLFELEYALAKISILKENT
eukprot:snap_masked-scaffold_25-processed-gene-1.2-mRNA-1 protein AED:1.00 eAED:1.00 QI:0/-1/0/0/-1/1/1/0/561